MECPCIAVTENEKFIEKLRMYDGTYLSTFFVPDEKRMRELLSAKVYDDDIWIVTYPKSGKSYCHIPQVW